ASRTDRSEPPAHIRDERCHYQQHDCRNGRGHFTTHQVKSSGTNHHDHYASGRTGDKPRLNARETRKRQSHRRQYFGDSEKELKPARERRVQLVGDRRRWNEKHGPVGEERQRQQHLEHPEQNIHAVPPFWTRSRVRSTGAASTSVRPRSVHSTAATNWA